ncbi:hypothetical protein EYF80_056094 [Liparis tanakae]|uniref:Uncharacterized protein n=1 Tax=Liparis tanakae TaxID=230148 RepID=A0A4Z2EXS6_9TELE|nr:hypothetical protein EYF80_056094 [Liparis tanakae]
MPREESTHGIFIFIFITSAAHQGCEHAAAASTRLLRAAALTLRRHRNGPRALAAGCTVTQLRVAMIFSTCRALSSGTSCVSLELADVAQLAVGHVLHEQPVHVELALPLVLRPDAGAGAVVHRRAHLRHAAEVPAAVDAEQQVHGAGGARGPEGLVQPLVAVLRAAPDGVLDGAVDVVLGVALDDEDAAALRAPLEVLGVVAVGGAQLVEHRVGLAAAAGRLARARLGAAAPAAVAHGHRAAVVPVALVAVARGDPAGLGLRGRGVVLVGLRRRRVVVLVVLLVVLVVVGL